jgi:GNAT superfamily N-acetyltransferase
MQNSPFFIRKGTMADVASALDLIKELALYEKAPQEVTNTEADMLRDGFGEHPYFDMWVAIENEVIVGLALTYVRYSTWKGKMLYLEDIVVTEKSRGRGIGRALFLEVCKKVQQDQLNGLIWQVLDWNEPALHFYKKFNASLDPEWVNGKLLPSTIDNLLRNESI